MASRKSAQSSATDAGDPLAEAIHHLGDEVRVLRDVLDEFREDFSCLIRNGMPIQPVEHIAIKRMAADPLAEDWAQRLEVVRTTLPVARSRSQLDPESLGDLMEEFETVFTAVAQGQLEVMLIALDGVRDQIVSAIRKRAEPVTASSPKDIHAERKVSPAKSEPGRLF